MNQSELLQINGVVGFAKYWHNFCILVFTRDEDPDSVCRAIAKKMNVGVMVEVMPLDGYDFPEVYDESQSQLRRA
jgi:hypothetical protein